MRAVTKKYTHWSPEEIILLKELYTHIRVSSLVARFPWRNKKTIVAKAFNLGLPSAKLWRPAEDHVLKNYFTQAPREELLGLLPSRSWPAILARGERLNLRRKTDEPRLTVNTAYFQNWSTNMSYLVGFILADGCIVEGTYDGYSDALKFGVQKSDIDILYKIKKELHSDHKISEVKRAVHLTITSSKIVNDLKKLGVSYRKSLREKVPPVPGGYIKDFIRGLVDGDGGISLNEREFPTLSYCGGARIVTFVRNHFLEEFGIFSKVHKRSSIRNKNLYLASITYRGNSAKKLIAYLYKDSSLYLDRKYHLALRCLARDIKPRKNYTEEENIFIRQSYPIYTREKLLTLLPGRSWPAIKEQAWALGAYKHPRRKEKSII